MLHHPFSSKHLAPELIPETLHHRGAFPCLRPVLSHIRPTDTEPDWLSLNCQESAANVMHRLAGIKTTPGSSSISPSSLGFSDSIPNLPFSVLPGSATMRGILASSVVLYAASSALGGLIPYSELKARGYGNANPLLDCLDAANLNPVVEGDSAYAKDASPFNLRCVPRNIVPMGSTVD